MLFHVGNEVACHLGGPGAIRVGGHAEEVHDPAFDLDHEEHVVTTEQHGVDGEEVGCQDQSPPGRGGTLTSVGPWRRGAGGSPCRRRTVATLVLETGTPSFLSSPTMRR